MNSRHELETSSAAELDTDAFHPTRAGEANQSVTSVPGKPGMIVRSYPFLDLEMPVEFMTEWITPVSRFFVRNHMFEPAGIDPATWKLTINGQVDKPLTLTLSDLRVGHVYEVRLKNLTPGGGMFHPDEAHYTLRQVPD